MEYRQMGKRGLQLSCLGLGSYLTIGFKCDEKTSRELVSLAYDQGINFFDTANAYNKGEAEKALGKCLKEYPRSSFVILTKVWAPMGPGPNDKGLSAKHIFEQCHASLKRLGMDYVDIYMCHRPDPSTPLEETIRAMEDLAKQGKILYWGVSEWSISQILKAKEVAKEIGARPISVNEPRYNLFYREPEKEIFPLSIEEGIGNVIFSPLAHGMLTGKYLPSQPPPESSRAADPEQNMVIKKMYWEEENKKKAQELSSLAKESGATAGQLAIAWCLRHPAVTSVILGARTIEQLKENIQSLNIKTNEEIIIKLEKIFPPPKESTKV